MLLLVASITDIIMAVFQQHTILSTTDTNQRKIPQKKKRNVKTPHILIALEAKWMESWIQ